MNTLRSIVIGAALLTLPAEAQDHRFESDPVATVREDFVVCDVLSQLQRVVDNPRFLLTGECEPLSKQAAGSTSACIPTTRSRHANGHTRKFCRNNHSQRSYARGKRTEGRLLEINRKRDFSERYMIFKVKILLSIVSFLLLIAPSAAADFTYQEYAKAPELWKRGFVFGISRYMSAVAQPDEEAPYPMRTAFQRCLANSTDTLLVRQVETYVATNPASSKEPIVAVIMRAFFNLCRAEIEKAQSPKAAPSHR
jgi:hypothetical protein